eukprot:6990583-Pyramimonas_sp.AAC.1
MPASVCARVCRRSVAAQSGGRPKRPGPAALAEGHYNTLALASCVGQQSRAMLGTIRSWAKGRGVRGPAL